MTNPTTPKATPAKSSKPVTLDELLTPTPAKSSNPAPVDDPDLKPLGMKNPTPEELTDQVEELEAQLTAMTRERDALKETKELQRRDLKEAAGVIEKISKERDAAIAEGRASIKGRQELQSRNETLTAELVTLKSAVEALKTAAKTLFGIR